MQLLQKLFLFLFSLLVSHSFSQTTLDTFWIGTWYDARLTKINRQDSIILDSIKKANFNFVSGQNLTPNINTTDFTYALGRAAAVKGLKVLVMDSRFNYTSYNDADCKSIVNYYKSLSTNIRNAMLGYHIGDEPADNFIISANRWVDTLKKYDAQKIPYIGLLPVYVGYDTTRYKNYINNFIANSSQIIGYDHYPFFVGGKGMREDYFWNLRVVADALKSNPTKNFWATVQAVEATHIETGFHYAPITQNLLRFVAYAPILYGAKGIMYFTYESPGLNGGWVYEKAARENPNIYNWLKSQNLYLKNMGPTLMKLKWLATVHGWYQTNYSLETVPTIISGVTPYIKTISDYQTGVGIFDSSTSVHFLAALNKDTLNTKNVSFSLAGYYQLQYHKKTSVGWNIIPGAFYSTGNQEQRFTLPFDRTELHLIRMSPPDCKFYGWDFSNNGYGDATVKPVPADYDNDKKTDISVLTANGNWLIDYSKNGIGPWDINYSNHGDSGGVAIPADYDGDGKSDLAVYTPAGIEKIDTSKNGFNGWDVIINTVGGTLSYVQPCPADYDNDKKCDLAVLTTDDKWLIDYKKNKLGSWDITILNHGAEGGKAVPADYDGDGKLDLAVLTGNGIWRIDFANNGFNGWEFNEDIGAPISSVVPVPADYDGDKKVDISVKAPFQLQGEWLIDFAKDGFGSWNFSGEWYGDNTAVPSIGDYDGDGKTDISEKTYGEVWLINYASY